MGGDAGALRCEVRLLVAIAFVRCLLIVDAERVLPDAAQGTSFEVTPNEGDTAAQTEGGRHRQRPVVHPRRLIKESAPTSANVLAVGESTTTSWYRSSSSRRRSTSRSS